MKRTAVFLTILILLSKIFGLARGLTLSYFYGSGVISDVFFTAWSIPNSIFGFIVVGLVTTFIPVYIRITEKEGKPEAKRYMDLSLSLMIIAAALFMIFALIFTEPLVKLFASGYYGDKLELAVEFTRIMIFATYFIGARFIYSSYNEINGNFYVAPLTGLMVNIVVIVFTAISVKKGLIFLPLGLVIGSFIEFVILWFTARRTGYRFKINLSLKNPYLKTTLIMAFPIMIGASVDQINFLVDRSLATTFGDGATSILSYANQVNDSVVGLFVVALTTVLFPILVSQAVKKEYTQLKITLTKTINMVNVFIIPAMIGIMILSEPIVLLLFGKSKISPSDLQAMHMLLFFYSAGIIGYGLRMVLNKTFYALDDTKTPVKIGVISVVVNVVLDFILAYTIGLEGLAIATSFSAILGAMLLYNELRKKLNGLDTKNIIISTLKIFASSLIMGFFVYQGFSLLSPHVGLPKALLMTIIGACAIYMVALRLVRVHEYTEVMDAFYAKIKSKI